MPHSRRSSKRRKKISKRVQKKVTNILILPHIKKLIENISDENIPSERRLEIKEYLYDSETGKLKPEFYRVKERIIR